VQPNPIEIIYRYFLTRSQRQAREQFVPTEYSNLHIDDKGLVYTTTRNVREGQIKRLNALGDDIMKHEGIGRGVYGDLILTPRNSGRQAQFMSVCLDADENVYALDNATGKVFAYDRSGELLFIFGGKGDQVGLFTDPHAVAVTPDGQIYVLDAGRGTVTEYRFTEFGQKILYANHLYLEGKFRESLEPWLEVARMDASYTEAFYYIGWAYIGQKEYAKAMEYFKLGHGPDGYSRAFGELRDDWFRANFATLFTLIAVGLIGLVVFVRIRRKKKGRGKAHA
jgi:tetratricopeptide (TPR) repeat protein